MWATPRQTKPLRALSKRMINWRRQMETLWDILRPQCGKPSLLMKVLFSFCLAYQFTVFCKNLRDTSERHVDLVTGAPASPGAHPFLPVSGSHPQSGWKNSKHTGKTRLHTDSFYYLKNEYLRVLFVFGDLRTF